jgi:hypothetical protein
LRNPQRWRNISLAFFVSSFIAIPAPFLLPEAAAGDTARLVLFIYGLMALIFGGVNAFFRHVEVRALAALSRGEDLLARWHIDAATWREFRAHNSQFSAESPAIFNELTLREDIPEAGIEVLAGKAAVLIGDSIHVLPRRGTPEVTHALLTAGAGGPACIEFRLYYPGGGHGASGVPFRPRRTFLRFPVARGALTEAEAVVHFYESGRPGEADFFHGRGDGTDAEDVSVCYQCGYQTHKLVSHCPQCGAGVQSKRWSRRFGFILVLCGLFISGAMGAVLYYTAPLMLQPGVRINGTAFSGTAAQGLLILGFMGAVAVFGLTTLFYGVWQMATGKRDLRVAYFLVALFTLFLLIARWL